MLNYIKPKRIIILSKNYCTKKKTILFVIVNMYLVNELTIGINTYFDNEHDIYTFEGGVYAINKNNLYTIYKLLILFFIFGNAKLSK